MGQRARRRECYIKAKVAWAELMEQGAEYVKFLITIYVDEPLLDGELSIGFLWRSIEEEEYQTFSEGRSFMGMGSYTIKNTLPAGLTIFAAGHSFQNFNELQDFLVKDFGGNHFKLLQPKQKECAENWYPGG